MRGKSILVLTALALLAAPAAAAPEPAPVGELRALYDELMAFKDVGAFRAHGFAPAGRYHPWLKRVDALRARWPRQFGFSDIERKRACLAAPGDLKMIALGYAQGRDPLPAQLEAVQLCAGVP